ncbi:MAG: SPASM domain-containing protein [Oscillospiraceae bacterium]|nr:SPASM domain-containing protein [Oscillospiraceae bacterium]
MDNNKDFTSEAGRVADKAAARPFTVMAKPVGALCNLDCGYCYYKSPARNSDEAKVERTNDEAPGAYDGEKKLSVHMSEGAPGAHMRVGLLEAFVRDYIKSSTGPNIYFTWHGGEPVLAGLDFYRAAVRLQDKYAPNGWRCINNIQTNGTLLDDEWCAFLAENRFEVGLSLDGTQWAHDTWRMDRSGGGSYEAAAAAVHRLKSYGINPDLLCTVTPQTAADPLGVYRALKDMGTGWVQFIPIVRRGEDGADGTSALPVAGSVSPDDYGAFLCTVFDEWISHDLGKTDVQLFAESARVLAGDEAGLCWMAPECGRVLIVERDGGVYSCDHYVYPEYKIGDISDNNNNSDNAGSQGSLRSKGNKNSFRSLGSKASLRSQDSLRSLVDSPTQRRFGESKRTSLPSQCLACEWLALCNGGCPKDRFASTQDGEPGLNYLCGGLKRFFSHAEKPLKQMVELSSQRMTPEAIMGRMHMDEKAKWIGVGRNDPCPCGSGKKAKNCCMRASP